MTKYEYRTDAESGFLEASDWNNACAKLNAMLSDAMIADGAWGWVRDDDGRTFYRPCRLCNPEKEGRDDRTD